MKATMLPASAILETPSPVETETDSTELSTALSRNLSAASNAFSPTLSKSNSTASGRFSVKSHDSVRAIGTIPFGGLRLHGRSDSEVTEKDMVNSITEERFDAHLAPKCPLRGDVFRLLDFPDEFIVGHDSIAMTTSESIQGFRDIPAGTHFLWVQKPDSISRCGYWYITELPGVVRVKQWDKFNEVLGEAASQYEIRDQEANIETIYPSLKTYALSAGDATPSGPTAHGTEFEPSFTKDPRAMWRQLTNGISKVFLDRVTCKRGVSEWLIDSMDSVKGDTRLPASIATASETYRTIVGSELQFLFTQDFQDLKILDHDPSSTDTSSRVLAVLDQKSPPVREQDIVAELQFTFVTGTHLGNTACLDQWWNLVLRIVLRSYQLALRRPVLCQWLLETLHAQLVYTDNHVEPLQGDHEPRKINGPSGDRLLFHALSRSKTLLHGALVEYKRRLNSSLVDLGSSITAEQEAIGHAFESLESWLWRCGWDLRSRLGRERVLLQAEDVEDDEEDDELPVIVDLDEDGREVGLVSFHRD
ncbi:hypothetical protein OQA88_9253 [Cercophora sp. LCS_1]